MKYFKIIIPNYNNEEWIEKCVNSILSQTFDNYMIIIIDDVSTDNSRNKILELYYNNPDKISYVFLENKRFNGGSRNVGIETTFFKSEYTMFIDGDDWFVDNNCLQDIYNLIQQNNKWASSQYRYVADLMDLKCTNEYCEIERITRLNACLNYIKNGIITQDK